MMTDSTAPHIVILAAGQGKRMYSDLPKVVHQVLFRPMLHYVLDLAESIPTQSITVVVGHGEEVVRKACENYSAISYVRQDQQRGTGDAVKSVESHFKGKKGTLLLMSGDVISLTSETLTGLLAKHYESKAACTVATTLMDLPRGYGRIVRGPGQTISDIREEADCSDADRRIREINGGLYCFEISELFPALAKIQDKNNQHEFYLTDVIRILSAENKRVVPFVINDSKEIAGINDRYALWQVEAAFQDKINQRWMLKGVSLQDPKTTWIDSRTTLEPDCSIESGCTIINSHIGKGSHLESFCRVTDSRIDDFVHIKQGSYIEKSEIATKSSVGPYAHLRPGSILESAVKIGNFVELKKTRMGAGSKASHLSYVGDAEIGKDVNLGCGFITCNFDGGPEKHKTIIEDGVFVGSDSQTVAPVRIGKGSYIASGSTVTEDVPAESLVLTRGKQTTKPGYAKKYRR